MNLRAFPYSMSYAEALAAFKRDCNEIPIIADLLRREFAPYLLEPILDVGAGAGELAALAFPDHTAFLLDLDPYRAPRNVRHTRKTGNFESVDLAELRSNTILFCHSMNYLVRDIDTFVDRVVVTGAKGVLII